MKHLVIGYESPKSDFPYSWGPAAVRTSKGVYNSVLPGQRRYIDQEEWTECYASGCITFTEVEIEVPPNSECMVVDLRLDLLDRAPYALNPDYKYSAEVKNIIAVARGTTRGYYIFGSLKSFETWHYHLLAGPYELTAAKELTKETSNDPADPVPPLSSNPSNVGGDAKTLPSTTHQPSDMDVDNQGCGRVPPTSSESSDDHPSEIANSQLLHKMHSMGISDTEQDIADWLCSATAATMFGSESGYLRRQLANTIRKSVWRDSNMVDEGVIQRIRKGVR